MTLEDLRLLGASLATARLSESPYERLATVLDDILVEGFPLDVAERPLVFRIAERLDTTRDEPKRFLCFAADVVSLIEQSCTPGEVDSLLELVAERERTADVIGKYLNGPISRTGFLSYLSERRWPTVIRRSVGSLSDDELTELRGALTNLNVGRLREVLDYHF